MEVIRMNVYNQHSTACPSQSSCAPATENPVNYSSQSQNIEIRANEEDTTPSNGTKTLAQRPSRQTCPLPPSRDLASTGARISARHELQDPAHASKRLRTCHADADAGGADTGGEIDRPGVATQDVSSPAADRLASLHLATTLQPNLTRQERIPGSGDVPSSTCEASSSNISPVPLAQNQRKNNPETLAIPVPSTSNLRRAYPSTASGSKGRRFPRQKKKGPAKFRNWKPHHWEQRYSDTTLQKIDAALRILGTLESTSANHGTDRLEYKPSPPCHSSPLEQQGHTGHSPFRDHVSHNGRVFGRSRYFCRDYESSGEIDLQHVKFGYGIMRRPDGRFVVLHTYCEGDEQVIISITCRGEEGQDPYLIEEHRFPTPGSREYGDSTDAFTFETDKKVDRPAQEQPIGPTRKDFKSPVPKREDGDKREAGPRSCIRCRFQKQGCVDEKANPDGECKACKSFSRTSKKTLHRSPCFRGKVADVILFRRGGLCITGRWAGTSMKDVRGRSDFEVRTIAFTLGVWTTPIIVDVVQFPPLESDLIHRQWFVNCGGVSRRKVVTLEPFCLWDIIATAKAFKWYIKEHAVYAYLYRDTLPATTRENHPKRIFSRTWRAAVKHYHTLPKFVTYGNSLPQVNPEKRLMGLLFIVWFSNRHTRGSSWIIGDDTLGMQPQKGDPTYPLHNKVALPRMILAQFDSITYTKLLAHYGKMLLQLLDSLIFQNQPTYWFTIYCVMFTLLSEASRISKDRYRHARENGITSSRYSIPSFVQELHQGCNILLMHWHYYNCRPWPGSQKEQRGAGRSLWEDLTEDQYELIKDTMVNSGVRQHLDFFDRYRRENGSVERNTPADSKKTKKTGPRLPEYTGSQKHMNWDDPFYWVSQLFENDWNAHQRYEAEMPKPSDQDLFTDEDIKDEVSTPKSPTLKPEVCEDNSLGGDSIKTEVDDGDSIDGDNIKMEVDDGSDLD